MATLTEIDFRKLYHKVVLFKDIDERNKRAIQLSDFPMRDDDNALLVYGYIDHEAGLSFEVLCAAYAYGDGRVSLEPGGETTSLKFRFESFQGEVEPFNDVGMLLPYKDKIDMIDKCYECSEDIKDFRSITEIDSSRAPGYPDDIIVFFLKDDEKAEGIWCRVESVDHKEGVIQAKLLNEPYRQYGYHMSDIVPVGLIKMDNGELKAVAIL